MRTTQVTPERALDLIAGLLLVSAVVPGILLAATGGSVQAAWAAVGLGQGLVALGLRWRSRLALVVAQITAGLELFMGVLLCLGLLVVREGTLYAGARGTWLYTESPAVVVPLLAVALALTYWQWITLGRADVVDLFRRSRTGVRP